jgi:hypothetical protein
MSDETRVRYFVRNHQNQPVELHLVTSVVSLGPRGEGEVQAGDLEAPQLKVLRRNRLVTVREVIETLSKTAPESGNADREQASSKAVEAPPEAAPTKPAGRPKQKPA